MAIKRKTRMYEPWGYIDENNYESVEIIHDNDLASFFADVSYNKDDNKIHFDNKDGEEVGTLDVSEFLKSDSIVEKAWYENGKIYIKFTNGDVITINVEELIDQNEFAAGLQVNDGIVSVLINAESDDYISVDTDGIKLTGVKADIEAEKARAISEEQRIEGRLDDEIARATAEEDRIDAKLDQEITDRKADVDAEEARATAEETTIKNTIGGGFSTASTETVTAKFNDLATALDTEIGNRTTQDNQLQNNINTELTARQAADTRLENLLTDERNRAIGEEVALKSDLEVEIARAEGEEAILNQKINAETSRATNAETQLQAAIESEGQRAQDAEEALDTAKADKVDAVASAEYDSSAVTINFKNINGYVISSIDVSDFIKDGMIDNVKIEGGNLVIIFNTDSGKEEIDIPLTEIFDPENYYTKAEVDGFIGDLQDAIAAEEARAISAETDLDSAIALKADADTVYTQEEVDALLLAKENEIYNLTKIVGDMGGAVTYDLPNPAGKSFNTLMNNNGTVKLTDDATTGRFGPGITAKNKVKLNLNNNDLTITGLTITSAQGGIMARGTQEITIYGKGTIDTGNGICIEGNGADSVINLTGSTTVYQTDRSGGELIYCYAGTINITNGTFRNNGDDKTYMLNCYDANYRAGTAKIVVTGGKFYDFNPADNTAEGEHTNFVAEGYHVETSTVTEEGVEHTVYTVKKD